MEIFFEKQSIVALSLAIYLTYYSEHRTPNKEELQKRPRKLLN